MLRTRRVLLLGLSVFLLHCGGGGSGGRPGTPVSPWPQFRHDTSRTGGASGILTSNRGFVQATQVDENGPPSSIGSSPVIDSRGTVYIGSEGGTLRAVQRGTLETKWVAQSCAACCDAHADPSCDPRLGPIVASPALLVERDTTTLVVGDTNGRVYRFTIDETGRDPEPVCAACFAPELADDSGPAARAEVRSSAALTVNAVIGGLASAIVGVEIRAAPGTAATSGKVYAINADGTLRWQFPRRGDGVIGTVTSSPAIGLGGSVIVTAGDDSLYILSRDGALRQQISIGDLTAPDAFLQPSVVSSISLFVGSARGDIYAFNHDGSFRWTTRFPGRRFLGSLAIGAVAEPTPTPDDAGDTTPTPTATLAAGEPTPTPTPSPTPATNFSTVMGVSDAGELVFVEASTGAPLPPSGVNASLPTGASIVASPAISLDGFIVFADTGGQVHVMDTASGAVPRFCVQAAGVRCERDADCGIDDVCGDASWPLTLPARCVGGGAAGSSCDDDLDCPGGTCAPAAIRSSPALDNDGTIYVGADDGYLYAIGGPTPTPTPILDSSPTPTPGDA